MKKKTGRIEIIDQISSSDFTKYSGSKIVVLIPAHNSENSITRVIENLAKQRIPNRSHLRIVVCANACKDNTVIVAEMALLSARTKNTRITTSLIVTSQPGEPQALNRMLKKVTNEIVIVINDDVAPTKNSLVSLYIAMRNNEHIPAIGVPPRPSPEFTGIDQPLPIRIANQIGKIYTEAAVTIVGQMYAFRKSVIDYFPDIMSEDDYLTYLCLCKAKCYGILNDGHSYVYYKPPSTLSDVFEQLIVYARCGVQFSREYPEAADLFIEIEERMGLFENKNIFDGDTQVKKIALNMLDCARKIATLEEKINPIQGSLRKRVASTL